MSVDMSYRCKTCNLDSPQSSRVSEEFLRRVLAESDSLAYLLHISGAEFSVMGDGGETAPIFRFLADHCEHDIVIVEDGCREVTDPDRADITNEALTTVLRRVAGKPSIN